MPFGIQPIHIVIVAIAALLIFGPSRLPEIGRGVGRAITEFRRGAKDMGGSFMEEINQPIESPEQVQPAREGAAVVSSNHSGPTPIGEPASQGNFCIHCGKANPAGAVFCNQCGSKITE
jgi:sec-independent protein translocase protein TatA